ncbi:MAG TPA: GNAT family N-acetyltransferase [Smithellaceae bacterium]|nr:GNAT family N-acetyltransferase [Smithellaceae bacterium]
MIMELFQKLSSESLYLRFLRPIASLPEDLLFRLTHIDYNESFALVAVIMEGGRESIIAVARYSYDPATYIADAAVVVRDDWQRLGLGKSLLSKIYDIGREHGICRFVSVIAPTNRVIKQILRKLGYKVKYSYPSGATQVEVMVQKIQ